MAKSIKTVDSEYKKIRAELKEPLSKADNQILKKIHQIFPHKELFFVVDEENIELNINSVNLTLFENTIISHLNESNIEQNPIYQILEKLKKIGSYGIKGEKRIFIGYDRERKVLDRKDKIEKRGGGIKKKTVEKAAINTVPNEYINQIICGDSEEILKKLPSNCIDLVFTSPPYNFGLGYDTHEDGTHWDEYFAKLFAVFKECIRVVKPGGRIVINIQPLFSDYIPIHHRISHFFESNNLIWKGEILWEKNNYNCKYTAWGSWKSPSSPYLKYTWEFIEIFCKESLKKDGNKINIDITAEEFKSWVVARWSIAPERNMKQYGHPAMFPEELVRRVLKLFSFQEDVILDPFNGVGSTSVVSKKTGRKYIGIDISQEYCKIANIRLKELL